MPVAVELEQILLTLKETCYFITLRFGPRMEEQHMNQSLKLFLKRTPVYSFYKALVRTRIYLFYTRLRTASGYLWPSIEQTLKWLRKSNETTNFTYELHPLNRRYLASTISKITNQPYTKIMGYMDELEWDSELEDHIFSTTASSEHHNVADAHPKYGRRSGWYAFVRAMKPKIVVETGVDKGLGSCVITAALARNAQEGHPGYYYGTDINPQAGYLLCGKYAQHGEILYGDSIESLRKLEKAIDLFINDSDHSAVYEGEEYRTVSSKLTQNAIALGDNSHCTDELFKFSLEHNRNFLFFRESPIDHWYPGGGIGISF